MKKKLFLFIACLFLFSSLTVFFVYRNIQPVEVTKKEKEKKLPKKLENEKSQYQEEETDDDLPWTFTWKGAIISLIPSIVIAFIITIIMFYVWLSSLPLKLRNNETEDQKATRGLAFVLIASLICLFLYSVVFPAIFAIQKHKDKSYWERFWLANFSSLVKKIFNGINLGLSIINIIFAVLM